MLSHRDLESKISGFSYLQEDTGSLHILCLGPGVHVDNIVLALSGCHRWGEMT